ncbi:MAG: ATP-binding cassette domain-containing protein [Desulfurivibrionaceae bacterium]|jgi:cell division transport system ATP-binding protein
MSRDASTDKPLIELIDVTKIYPPDVVAVEDVSLRIYKGEILFLTGMSGAGKTTLIKLICRLEMPTSGVIEAAGRDLSRISPAGIQRMRQKIGVAYQEFRLLEKQTVLQNIAMAMEVTYAGTKAIHARVDELLAMLNLSDKRNKLAGELSRGEQQRVALARAAANGPSLLLADEPTGNLDPVATELVVNLLRHLNKKNGSTIVVATHDASIYADTPHRVIQLSSGQLSANPSRAPRQIELFDA